MRCHICDNPLKDVVYNSDHQDFEPCPTCLIEINDMLNAFLDTPAADEDAFGEVFNPGEFIREPSYEMENF